MGGTAELPIPVWGSAMSSTNQQQTCKRSRRCPGDEQAVSATEYAIMLALIVLGSMATIGAIGAKFHVLYTMIANAVGDTI